MDKIIVRGYIAQFIDGCDAVMCTNQYCKSCPKFLYKDKTRHEAAKLAIIAAREHTRKPHLCQSLAKYQLDPNYLSIVQFPNYLQFQDTKSLNKLEVLNHFKSEKEFPYLLLSEQDLRQPSKNSSKYKLDDSIFESFAKSVEKEEDHFFDGFPKILFKHIERVVKNEATTYTQFREIYLCLFFLTLFPTNDCSPKLNDLLKYIFSFFKDASVIHIYLIEAFRQTPNTLIRVLNYIQDNLTFAVLTVKSKDKDEVYKSEIQFLATFIEMLRIANYKLSTYTFSNEVISTNLAKTNNDLIRFLRSQFSYLDVPCVLSLRCKSSVLSLYFAFLQKKLAEEMSINRNRTYVNANDMNFVLNVRRDNLIEDAIIRLNNASSESFVKKLKVVFQGEQGVDVGGVSREFFHLVCNDIFNSKYGMFKETPNGKFWFVSPFIGRLADFSLLGTVVALALYNSVILPIRFPLLLYKKIWKMSLSLRDYEEIDPSIVSSLKNLRQMRDNGQDIAQAELTFSVTLDNYGELKEVPLVEGGINKNVTNNNLEQYIREYSNYLMNTSVQNMFAKFENGFRKVMEAPLKIADLRKLELCKLIAYDEFDILVSGEEIVHWDGLQLNCKYRDGYNKKSQAVIWFWEIFEEMSEEEKQQFFRFSTGSERAPVGGTTKFKLTIQKTNDATKLPVAHTCFNIFSLPNYPSKEEMKKKILISIANTEGFGLV